MEAMNTLDALASRLAHANNSYFQAVGALLDQVPLGLLLIDGDSRIQWWNCAAEELSGHPRESMLGQTWGQEFLLAVESDPVDSVGNGRSLLRHRDGFLLPVRTQVSSLPKGCGAGDGSIVSLADGTPLLGALELARRSPELDLIDPLTGLGNRRMAALELETFLIRYQLQHREFGVILFDVDMLHGINDRFGYDCSDRALRVVAHTLPCCLSELDMLCRWGGDQFLAIVAGRRERVETTAESCRWAVEWCCLDWFGEPVPITVSAGVDTISPGDHPEDLVGRAAFRLRMSKRLGRNRVTGCPPSQAE